MGKASEIWKEIKPKIGEMLMTVNDIETQAEKAQKEAYENGFIAGHLKAEKSGQSFYEDGYKTAKVQCNIQAEKDLREVGERHYQKGLSDAWEAARKICTNWVLPDSVLSKIFGMDKTIDDIMKENKASEAIEKIRAYEQAQKEIQVGDEVNAPFGKAIVVNIDFFAKKIWLVYADGHGGFEYFKDAPTKTGRHFPEIAEVLQKMKE